MMHNLRLILCAEHFAATSSPTLGYPLMKMYPAFKGLYNTSQNAGDGQLVAPHPYQNATGNIFTKSGIRSMGDH